MAEAVGCQPETVSRYESGSSVISLPMAFRIAEVLDVELVALLGVETGESLETVGPDERRLLTCWRTLDGESRAAVQTLLDKLAGQ